MMYNCKKYETPEKILSYLADIQKINKKYGLSLQYYEDDAEYCVCEGSDFEYSKDYIHYYGNLTEICTPIEHARIDMSDRIENAIKKLKRSVFNNFLHRNRGFCEKWEIDNTND